MNIEYPYPVFRSIAQRAAHSYLRALAEPLAVAPAISSAEEWEEMIASQRDLHAFFKALYENILQDPESFGLPTVEDAFLEDSQAHGTELKQVLNQKLKKPRELIAFGVDFLMMLGKDGSLEGNSLILEANCYSAYHGNSKNKKRFLDNFVKNSGLILEEVGDRLVFHCDDHPKMMPALQSLANACAQYTDEKLGKYNFARCDFQGLTVDHHPSALDLYRMFIPEDFERVKELDEYLAGLDYKPEFQIYGSHGWEVQYQGKRKIKTSPLVRIEYSERHRNPLRVNIKCASANRLIPLIYQQSERLRTDFLSRTYECRDDACGWCRNKKSLGPSLYEYGGESRSICWYTNPDFATFDDASVELIEEYAVFHEQLA